MERIKISVLSGAISSEREVSLVSGKFIAEALGQNFDVDLVQLDENKLPYDLLPEETVIFPVIHGEFGEDGELQKLLEEKGFSYAGSDAQASSLTIDKAKTKSIAQRLGLKVLPGFAFDYNNPPKAKEVIEVLGNDIVLKPNDKGSSVGVIVLHGEQALQDAYQQLQSGRWLLEKRVFGRDMTVGVLGKEAMGVVEIRPKVGFYDYHHKYTKGATEYLFPAPISEDLEKQLRYVTETIFNGCGCRDFARADFMVTDDNEYYFLEINTIPGLTSTSLLPKSASCFGYSFEELAKKMVEPAIERFFAKCLV